MTMPLAYLQSLHTLQPWVLQFRNEQLRGQSPDLRLCHWLLTAAMPALPHCSAGQQRHHLDPGWRATGYTG
jgi:hypothetical protein